MNKDTTKASARLVSLQARTMKRTTRRPGREVLAADAKTARAALALATGRAVTDEVGLPVTGCLALAFHNDDGNCDFECENYKALALAPSIAACGLISHHALTTAVVVDERSLDEEVMDAVMEWAQLVDESDTYKGPSLEAAAIDIRNVWDEGLYLYAQFIPQGFRFEWAPSMERWAIADHGVYMSGPEGMTLASCVPP